MIMADGTVANAMFTFKADILQLDGVKYVDGKCLTASLNQIESNARQCLDKVSMSVVKATCDAFRKVWSSTGHAVLFIEGSYWVSVDATAKAVKLSRENIGILSDSDGDLVKALLETLITPLEILVGMLLKSPVNILFQED